MTIPLQCGECGKEYRVKDEAAGKRMRCRDCGKIIAIPARRPRVRRHAEEPDGFLAALDSAATAERSAAHAPTLPPASQKRTPPTPSSKPSPKRKRRKRRSSPAFFIPPIVAWVVGGSIGGAVGAGIWTAVGYFSGYEVGWIAWGVGFLVGAGARVVANLAGQDESLGEGLTAGAIAMASVLGAKYLVVFLALQQAGAEAMNNSQDSELFNDEAMIASFADRIAQQRIKAGQELDWPPGMTYEDAVEKGDYPSDVWQEAEHRWKGLTPDKQEQIRTEARQEFTHMLSSEVSVTSVFLKSFSMWDGLWFFLATATAFRIGCGTYSRD